MTLLRISSSFQRRSLEDHCTHHTSLSESSHGITGDNHDEDGERADLIYLEKRL